MKLPNNLISVVVLAATTNVESEINLVVVVTTNLLQTDNLT